MKIREVGLNGPASRIIGAMGERVSLSHAQFA